MRNKLFLSNFPEERHLYYISHCAICLFLAASRSAVLGSVVLQQEAALRRRQQLPSGRGSHLGTPASALSPRIPARGHSPCA